MLGCGIDASLLLVFLRNTSARLCMPSNYAASRPCITQFYFVSNEAIQVCLNSEYIDCYSNSLAHEDGHKAPIYP
jgi:hypothetical protein